MNYFINTSHYVVGKVRPLNITTQFVSMCTLRKQRAYNSKKYGPRQLAWAIRNVIIYTNRVSTQFVNGLKNTGNILCT
jgi:hypothetical protein